MYLLDTNVVSELRPRSSRISDPRVIAWARSVSPSSLYLSVICIFEMRMGILQKQRTDQAQAAVLRSWLTDYVLRSFSDRILPVDTAVALQCAALHVPNPSSYRDSLIAATALVHSMTVVTRNVSHFAKTGVKLLNPWEAQAAQRKV
ncbi:MAG TPA: type II toxin-antitoxin system VapC family toxin [Terracidiphilus sp.]|nr:type II toxin-antitoxin system VapC family toxin [Terracidiphilus sp.]